MFKIFALLESLLPSAGREMSTSQSAVMLCGWEVKAGIGGKPVTAHCGPRRRGRLEIIPDLTL